MEDTTSVLARFMVRSHAASTVLGDCGAGLRRQLAGQFGVAKIHGMSWLAYYRRVERSAGTGLEQWSKTGKLLRIPSSVLLAV